VDRVGFEKSEHIGNIKIDPRNSSVVYVAVQGPLWAPGGDRGLFKTTDGGQTWKSLIPVSADTGVNEVQIDPANPDLLYASTYQRRRAVGQFVGGGPEGGSTSRRTPAIRGRRSPRACRRTSAASDWDSMAK
jgi:hypothetical protein